jgi:cell division protein FtsB|tara:strand:+ start:238 stop:447 length:210 start_codon:yes stop_codon:yes gene_type:complete
MSDKGPNDLEQQIEDLKKQKEYLQKQCRKAGGAILDQELQLQDLRKEIDRLSEENDNLKTMLESRNGGK